MVRVTYQTYSRVLDKHFEDSGVFRSMEDFRIFACALFSGNWCVLNVETV